MINYFIMDSAHDTAYGDPVVSIEGINSYIRNKNFLSEYNEIHSNCIKNIITGINLFTTNVKTRFLNRFFISSLLWTHQKYCAENLDKCFNIKSIKSELLETTENYCPFLYSIVKFIGQFTSEDAVHSTCVHIVQKLSGNHENIIHLFSFNKNFRPKHTLTPQKSVGFNRIIHFCSPPEEILCGNYQNPYYDNYQNLRYHEWRTVNTYYELTKDIDCSDSFRKVKEIYFLNSLLEFYDYENECRTCEFKLSDISIFFDCIQKCLYFHNMFDEDIHNKIMESLKKMIIGIYSSDTIIEITESDILGKFWDIDITSLFDLNDFKQNDEEVAYIINEIRTGIPDFVHPNQNNMTKFDKKMVNAFIFMTENNLVGGINKCTIDILKESGYYDWIKIYF